MIDRPIPVHDLPYWHPGARFYFSGGYDTLAYCVRNDPAFGFADGTTIAEAGSHSSAELWTDVITPAIAARRIFMEIDGNPVRLGS
jgi:hypothetical protein